METVFAAEGVGGGARTFVGAVRSGAENADFISNRPDCPKWLNLLVHELSETAPTCGERAAFLKDVEEALEAGPDLEAAEARFMLSRINSGDCAIRTALVALKGERDSYTLAFQQLTFALRLAALGAEEAGAQLEAAVANLKREAPGIDRGLICTGATLSYVLMTLSGVWTAALRESTREETRDQAWRDARSAARRDLATELRDTTERN